MAVGMFEEDLLDAARGAIFDELYPSPGLEEEVAVAVILVEVVIVEDLAGVRAVPEANEDA